MASRAVQPEFTQAPYRATRQSERGSLLQVDALLVGYDGGDLLERPFVRPDLAEHAIFTAGGTRTEFKAHYAQWLEDSLFDSLPDRMRRHESYQAIVDLGDRVVPLIAAELRKEPSFLFLALEDIVEFDPVPDHAHGNLRATAAAWLAWLRK